MNNWRKVKLDTVADIKLSNVDKKTTEGEKPIRLCNYTDVYKYSFINREKSQDFMVATCNDNEYEKFLLKKGQVAITKDSEKRNDIGIPTFIAEDFDDVVLGYHLALITPYPDKLDGAFLHFWLNTEYGKKYFENNASGSGQRLTLTLDIIKSIPLYLPDLPSQKSIAKVLSDLDAKIELNNKINRELEAMAKTLYDYWFVQFDFPNEQGKPYKSSGGKMVYNAELKREIPEGWEVKKLGDYASIKKGTLITEKTADITGKVKVVSAGIDFSYFHSESNYPENTITISASGANAGYINFWREPIFACDCTTVRGKNTEDTLQILGFLKLRQEYLYKQARGSAQPHVYPKDVEGLKIPIPPHSLLDKFGKIAVPSNEQIKVNIEQNQHLTALRDWLLPMLMNGQVTVRQAHGKQEAEERMSMAAEPSGEYKTKTKV